MSKSLPLNKRLCVDVEIYNRVIQRTRYGQTPCGALKELLDLVDQIEGKSTEPKEKQ
jgi:hypothetical protein